MPSWDDERGFDGSFDNENDYEYVEDSNDLVSQPRQVGFLQASMLMHLVKLDVDASC
jgi:hypothetical protein